MLCGIATRTYGVGNQDEVVGSPGMFAAYARYVKEKVDGRDVHAQEGPLDARGVGFIDQVRPLFSDPEINKKPQHARAQKRVGGFSPQAERCQDNGGDVCKDAGPFYIFDKFLRLMSKIYLYDMS